MLPTRSASRCDAPQDVRDGPGGLLLRRIGAISGGLLPLGGLQVQTITVGPLRGSPASWPFGVVLLTRSRVRRPGRGSGLSSACEAVQEGRQMVTRVSAEGYTGVRSSDELRGEHRGF